MGLITSFFIWVYIQRVNLKYDSEGRFFSVEDGIIYHEQTKEVYGILALLGLILIGLFMAKIITQITSKP